MKIFLVMSWYYSVLPKIHNMIPDRVSYKPQRNEDISYFSVVPWAPRTPGDDYYSTQNRFQTLFSEIERYKF